MKCRKCKKEIPEGSAYCNHCGTKQAVARQANRRDDGTYMTSTRYLGDDGKQRRQYFYGKSRAEAERKKEVFVRRLEDDRRRAAGAMPNSPTVKEYADKWFEQHTALLAHSSRVMYANGIKKLEPIYEKTMADVTRSDLQDIINALGKKRAYSQSFWDQISSTVTQIFGTAEDDGLLSKNPTRRLKYPDGGSGTHRCLETWEIDLITQSWSAHRAGIWIMLMLYTGIRRGEALALTWDDVDFENETVSIQQSVSFVKNRPVLGPTKTKSGVRTIPLPAALSAALRACQRVSSGRRYICSTEAEDGPMSAWAFRRGWEGLLLSLECAANGLPAEVTPGRKRKLPKDKDALARYKQVNIRAHDLRHTYATMLFDAGVDVKTAQRYIGHADIGTTMRIYTHLSEEREATSRESLLDYFAQKAGEAAV